VIEPNFDALRIGEQRAGEVIAEIDILRRQQEYSLKPFVGPPELAHRDQRIGASGVGVLIVRFPVDDRLRMSEHLLCISLDAFFIANKVVGYVGGLYSSLPTTTFWLIHVASAVIGLIAFWAFKIVVGQRMVSAAEDQAKALG